jgi:uncharacterized membrane protein
MKRKFEDDEEESWRNDPENYKFGIFYFNPIDPRIFVPKRIKELGWTLNFANPFSWLIIIGIITFAILLGKL